MPDISNALPQAPGATTDGSREECAGLSPAPVPNEIEIALIDHLITEVDQLAVEAVECRRIVPQAYNLLLLAGWHLEEARAEATGYLSCGHDRPNIGGGRRIPYCCCCELYRQWRPKAASLKGRI